jgi:hypothetical protein
MNKYLPCVATLSWSIALAGSVCAAQTPSGGMPNYQVSHPNYQYAAAVSSLQDVDFKNLKSLTTFSPSDDKPNARVDLVDGKSSHKYEADVTEIVSLDLVKFIDGGQRAVIDIVWTNCGASCSDGGIVQVFELQANHPTVVEQIMYSRHAPNTGAKLDAESRILTVTGRSAEASPNCCPKSLDVMNFVWGDEGFILKNRKRVTLPDAP